MKKIIAVILIVSFLAVTPAQADGPDRSAYAADQDRSEKADRPDRTEKADLEDREDVITPSIVGGVLMTTLSIGGGIPCCLASV